MASIDERVVAMSFENRVFEQRIAQTMATLQKLNAALANMGKANGLQDIEKAANKVTLQQPMSALDKLRQRLFGASQGAAEGFGGIDAAANKTTLQGPISALDRLRTRLFGASQGAAEGFGGIDAAGNRVQLLGPLNALDRLRARLGQVGSGAAQGFSYIETAANRVQLLNPLTAIDRLRARLGTVGSNAGQGFSEIERASNRVSFTGIGTAIDQVNKQFSGMQSFALGAVGGLVAGVTVKAKGLANALSLGPVTQGLEEYTTNLNSIQTILVNTKASGANLKDVNHALQQLNHYSDQTIYNFSEMAKNIGTFTAAGVDLKTAVGSIKGIANLAAMSGSNSQQASTAMYQLSQAIAAGRVSLQDWNSVVNAGMGGTVFQRALAQTAVAMGTLDKGAVQLKGKMKNVTIQGQSFRESITARPGEKSWLTSEVLTTALKNFTGDMSLAQIKAQGFSDAQAKAIMKQAEMAKKAATEVKTLKGVLDVAKESIGSGWAKTFQLIFGDFGQAKKTFTALSNSLQDMIGKSADARNKIFSDWGKLGGRTALIDGMKNAFQALMSVLRPVREAFRDVFPRKTGEDLYRMTVQFRDFMSSLKLSEGTAENVKRIFRGFFSVFSIGWTIIKGVAGVIFDLLGIIGKGSGGVLGFVGSIGDLIYSFDRAISKGKGFEEVFKALSDVLEGPMEMLKAIAGAIRDLFTGDDGGGEKVKSDLDGVTGSLEPLAKALKKIIDVWERLYQTLSEKVSPILEKVGDIFSKIGDFIMDGINAVDYDKVMEGLQTGLLAGLAVGIKKLLGGIGVDLSGGGIEAFKDVMDTLNNGLTAIQKNINAQTMLLIAAAVAALAAATVVFAHIDPKKLSQAMVAVSVGIGQLVGAMALLTRMGGGLTASMALLPFIAAGMLVLSGAVVILAGATALFSRLSWEDMVKGLTGVGGALLAISFGIRAMGPSLILVGPGLMAVAAAMTTLSFSMRILGGMSWGEMIKGIVGIGGALAALGWGMGSLGPTLLLVGPGLVAVGLGLILLSGAVATFGGMNFLEIGQGLSAIALSLITVGWAISAIPPTIALSAIGVGILAASLIGLSVAVGIFGSMSFGQIAKGLVAIGASLLIFAGGLTLMAGTMPGSLALLAAAAAFAVLTPTLVVLGQLSWQTIATGLAAMAATLGVLAAVGAIAATPLLALGIALVTIGAASALAGLGLMLIAGAVSKVAQDGGKGVAVLIAAVTAFIALLPKMVIEFLKGLTEILAGLVSLAPKIVQSLVSITNTVINGLLQIAPKAQVLFSNIIRMIIQTVNENAGPLLNAGFRLLLNFLNGLASNIGPITSAVARIIGNFLGAVVGHIPRIIANGARALGAFLQGMAQRLPGIIARAAQAVGAFLTGITRQLPSITAKGAQLISTFLNAVSRQLPRVISSGARVVASAITGVANALPRLISSGVRLVTKFMEGISRAIPRLVDQGFKMVIRTMNGIARAIRSNDDAMIDAGYNIAGALVEGIIKGMTSLAPRLKDKVVSIVASSLPGPVRKALGIKSPSTVFMGIGRQTMQGLAVGITAGARGAQYAIMGATNDIVSTASSGMAMIPANIGPIQPVITPVLDLSVVEREAQRLWGLSSKIPIDVGGALTTANQISREEMNRRSENTAGEDSRQTVLEYTQNNYSPEALSDIEIYRKTKNQLSTIKDALETAAGTP